MIVSLVADRRTAGVAEVAHDLAVGLRDRLRVPSMALYVDLIAIRAWSATGTDLVPQPLPGTMRAALTALRPEQHAVLAFVGTLTEPVLTAFDLSSKVLVLTDDGVASLRAAQRMCRLLHDVGLPRHRLCAIVLADDPDRSEVLEAARAALREHSFVVIPRGQLDPAARRTACAALAGRVLASIA